MSVVSGASLREVAEACFRSGDLPGCVHALQGAVRKDPADTSLRVFLAQLLMVQGDWERALNQLKVIGEVEASSLPMVHAYSAAIQCERLRAENYQVYEWTDPPGTTYETHKHMTDQSHWVIRGALALRIGEDEYVLRAGDRDWLPAGTPHSARVVGDEPATYLVGERSPSR